MAVNRWQALFEIVGKVEKTIKYEAGDAKWKNYLVKRLINRSEKGWNKKRSQS